MGGLMERDFIAPRIGGPGGSKPSKGLCERVPGSRGYLVCPVAPECAEKVAKSRHAAKSGLGAWFADFGQGRTWDFCTDPGWPLRKPLMPKPEGEEGGGGPGVDEDQLERREIERRLKKMADELGVANVKEKKYTPTQNTVASAVTNRHLTELERHHTKVVERVLDW